MGTQNKADWNKAYRLTLIEDQTHKRLKAYRFTKLGFLLAAITVTVVVVGSIWAVIALTPLRTTIPGYPDANTKRLAIQNAISIDSLENVITRWELYSENLSRVLAGQQTISIDSIIKGNTTRYLRAKSAEELERQDSILRATVNAEEQFGVSGTARRELPIEGIHFFCPMKGVVSQGFDMVLHPATDITAPKGTSVMAVLDGTVISSGWNDETGYSIVIQHEGDIISIYRHNQKLLRKTGDKVGAGTAIALVGSTGSLSTGDHLHFELWYKGAAVDPAKYISF